MSNKSKVHLNGAGNSFQITIPKAMYMAIGYKEGEEFEWQVIPNGFKLSKVKE